MREENNFTLPLRLRRTPRSGQPLSYSSYMYLHSGLASDAVVEIHQLILLWVVGTVV